MEGEISSFLYLIKDGEFELMKKIKTNKKQDPTYDQFVSAQEPFASPKALPLP